MRKRFLTLVSMALAMLMCIFGLTACGVSNNNQNDNGGGNSNIAVTSISLNRSAVTLEIGDTVSLYETIYPSNATDKSVTWSSSNTSVATVSNGTVRAKSAGTATITVRTGNDKTATCSISVNRSAPQTISVLSVSLNQASATLEVGDTLSLTAMVSPSNATDKSVTWSSSNTSVATVSNGTVRAKSAGTATITVKTSNNKTDSCSVTVNGQTVVVSSVSLNQSSATLEVGDTLNLTATIYPSNATDKSVTWSSSNTSVATVSDGTVTTKSAGTATITVRTSNNKTANCVIVCEEGITLNTPLCPLEMNDWGYRYVGVQYKKTKVETATLTNITYSIDDLSYCTKLTINIYGQITWKRETAASSFAMEYRIKDENGYVIETGSMLSDECLVGDKFIITEEIRLYDIASYGKNWTLELIENVSV